MNREGELRGAPGSREAGTPTTTAWFLRMVQLQWSNGAQLWAVQGMHAFNPALRSIDMQAAVPKIDLRPAKLAKFRSAEPMPIGEQDCRSVPANDPEGDIHARGGIYSSH